MYCFCVKITIWFQNTTISFNVQRYWPQVDTGNGIRPVVRKKQVTRVDVAVCRFPRRLSARLTSKREHDTQSILWFARVTVSYTSNRMVAATMTDTRRERVTFFSRVSPGPQDPALSGNCVGSWSIPSDSRLACITNTINIFHHFDFTQYFHVDSTVLRCAGCGMQTKVQHTIVKNRLI